MLSGEGNAEGRVEGRPATVRTDCRFVIMSRVAAFLLRDQFGSQ